MIVGLVGFIGAGKGTVGDQLRLHGYKQASFAGALKDTASQMFGWDRSLLEGDTDESRKFREQKDDFWSERFGYDFSPRFALQLLGTEAGRNVFHEDIWIYALENRIRNHKNVVVTDTRFPNEIDFIRSKGGIIVEVKRGDRPEWYETAIKQNSNRYANYLGKMQELYPDIHISEWAWIGKKVDYTIENDGTFDDLRLKVVMLLTEIEKSDNISMLNYEGVTNEVI
jgi:hypothetical protein